MSATIPDHCCFHFIENSGNFPSFNLVCVSVSEPGNTVKRDLYQLCQSFQTVDAQFSSLLSKLDSPLQTRDGEEQSVSGHKKVEDDSNPSTTFSSESAVSSESEKEIHSVSSKVENGTFSGEDTFQEETFSRNDSDGKISDKSGIESKVESEPVSAGIYIESREIFVHSSCDNSSARESGQEGLDSGVGECPGEVTAGVHEGGHYEECSVSSTFTVPRPATVEKSEIFITMKVPNRPDSQEHKPAREVSELERNLAVCELYLDTQLYLEDASSLEDEVAKVHSHLQLLAEAFVPANFTEEESAHVLSKLLKVKEGLREREKQIRSMLENLNQLREEVSGLSLWMKEVRAFLEAEDAVFGELETLEAQLKESNALQVRKSFATDPSSNPSPGISSQSSCPAPPDKCVRSFNLEILAISLDGLLLARTGGKCSLF